MRNNYKALIIVGIVLLSLILSFFSLDNGHDWGPDYSLYLSQAIAISEGRLDEEMARSADVFFSEHPIIVAWGYSLMLVPIHRLVSVKLL